MSQSDYSRDAVRKHQETIVKALKVSNNEALSFLIYHILH